MALVGSCPVCGGEELLTFLSRTKVPIHQNLVFKSQQEAEEAARGDLRVGMCRTCGFVLNQAFDPGLVLYGQSYDNTQTCSPSFKAYIDELVAHLVVDKGVRNAHIVEVGCGKGYFLNSLIDYPSAGNRGVGFDPSYEGPLSVADGRLRFDRRFYGPDCAEVKADVVVCRHVIEHVQDPRLFLETIRRALTQSPNAAVFFETPCVEWILRNQVVWDFFYEHCSLFSANSLRTLFERSGFSVSAVTHTFGGQYLWLEARLTAPSTSAIEAPSELLQLAERFGQTEQTLETVLVVAPQRTRGSRQGRSLGRRSKGGYAGEPRRPPSRVD